MKNLFLATTVLFSGLALGGCDGEPRVDLSQSKIISLEAVLPEGQTTFNITPGRSLELTFIATVEGENGIIETIDRIDHNTLAFEPGTGLSAEADSRSVLLGAESSNLRNWRTGYSLTFSVVGNAFPAQTLPIRMNFSRITEVSYSGSSGNSGNPVPTGQDGAAGSDGREVLVYTALVTDEEDRQWRLYRFTNAAGDSEFNRGLILPASQALKITANGGTGGNGGDGSNGDTITPDSDGSCSGHSSRADGGDGGDGGRGGDGGTIHLYGLSTDTFDGIDLRVSGGTGGNGGAGGRAGEVCGHNGWAGSAGENGRSGWAGETLIYDAELSFIQAQFAGQGLTGVTW